MSEARPSTYQAALLRLARRDHSVAELRRCLRRSGHEASAIEEAIERLRAGRALDDERFASGFARVRLAHHGVGRNRIRAALRQRGVARETAEKGLEDALRERPEAPVVDACARRLLRQHARAERRRRLAKVFAALIRRGFPPSLVRDRLAVLEPGCRDMLEDYGVAASEADSDEPADPE